VTFPGFDVVGVRCRVAESRAGTMEQPQLPHMAKRLPAVRHAPCAFKAFAFASVQLFALACWLG
jgi:hypothetical protein